MANPTPTRGGGFDQSEVDHILDDIEMFQPLGKDEWEVLAPDHTKTFREKNRTANGLKKKFRKRMPTRDPGIPDDVRRPRHLRYRLTELVEIAEI